MPGTERTDAAHTFLTVAAPLVLASEKGLQHCERLHQSALSLVEDDWKIIGLAEVVAHHVTDKAPNLFACSVRSRWRKKTNINLNHKVAQPPPSLRFYGQSTATLVFFTETLNALIYCRQQLENVKINLEASRTLRSVKGNQYNQLRLFLRRHWMRKLIRVRVLLLW